MNNEDTAVSMTSPKDKNENEKELLTLPADKSIKEFTNQRKKKRL